jgi:Na+/alanine symporter
MSQNTPPDNGADLDAVILNEMQVLLSEKRTALSALRTGIAIFALPLSVLSVLIVTSRLYDLSRVMHFLVPLLALNVGLVALATYLVVASIRRVHRYDRLILELKRRHSRLAELIV